MKRTLSILAATLVTLSLASVALATDGLGIFFDEAGTLNCNTTATPYTQQTLYLVAKDISVSSGVSGWECAILTEPATLPAGPLSVVLANSGLNVLASPLFQVGLPSNLPFAANITLATISFFYLGGPIKFGLGPCTPTSFPATPGPGYAAGDNPGNLVRLVPTSNVDSGTPNTFWVNYINVVGETCPGHPVADTRSSWSGVKALFN